MNKLSIEKKIFSTKQAMLIVLAVVAVIAFCGSSDLSDFFMKIIAYGVTSVLTVIISAKFLDDMNKNDIVKPSDKESEKSTNK